MTTASVGRIVRSLARNEPDAAAAPGTRSRAASAWLTVAGAALLPVGLVVILLGWYGAARTPFEVEQNSYLISGGVFGLGLVLTGAVLFLGGLLAATAERQRLETDRVVAALDRLAGSGATLPAAVAAAAGVLVRTPTGSMVHRPDCAVVANRDDVVPAALGASGLRPCGICHPEAGAA